VADMGPGLPASLEPRRASTLGMQLMHTLNRQLRGTLCIGATRAHETRPGATFEVSFPLASAGTSDPRG
jgi:two-component sensor histidine kinase